MLRVDIRRPGLQITIRCVSDFVEQDISPTTPSQVVWGFLRVTLIMPSLAKVVMICNDFVADLVYYPK